MFGEDSMGRAGGYLLSPLLEVLVDAMCTTTEYTGIEATSCDLRRHGMVYASFQLSGP